MVWIVTGCLGGIFLLLSCGIGWLGYQGYLGCSCSPGLLGCFGGPGLMGFGEGSL